MNTQPYPNETESRAWRALVARMIKSRAAAGALNDVELEAVDWLATGVPEIYLRVKCETCGALIMRGQPCDICPRIRAAKEARSQAEDHPATQLEEFPIQPVPEGCVIDAKGKVRRKADQSYRDTPEYQEKHRAAMIAIHARRKAEREGAEGAEGANGANVSEIPNGSDLRNEPDASRLNGAEPAPPKTAKRPQIANQNRNSWARMSEEEKAERVRRLNEGRTAQAAAKRAARSGAEESTPPPAKPDQPDQPAETEFRSDQAEPETIVSTALDSKQMEANVPSSESIMAETPSIMERTDSEAPPAEHGTPAQAIPQPSYDERYNACIAEIVAVLLRDGRVTPEFNAELKRKYRLTDRAQAHAFEAAYKESAREQCKQRRKVGGTWQSA